MNRKRYWIVVKRQGVTRSDITQFDPMEAEMARQAIAQAGDEIVLFAGEDECDEVRDIITRNQVRLPEDEIVPLHLD